MHGKVLQIHLDIYGQTESSYGVRQFIMSSIKVIACKRLLGSKTLSHCKMLKMSLSTLLSGNQGKT